MKKTTKILALVLAALLLVGGTFAATVALLTATDEAVNVMVAGDVMIEQLEKERDENGALQDFTQNKPWLPVTTKVVEKLDTVDWVTIGAPGSDLLYDSDAKGVLDKFVFVENTGTTDAYVRTIIAYECPVGLDTSLLHINDNEALVASAFFITIDGVQYMVREYLYPEALKPNQVSRPSLLQVYLDYYAENADIRLFDGKMDIRVVSQAVQAGGFDDAQTALDEAFGDLSAARNPWTATVPEGNKLSLIGGETVTLTNRTEPLIIDGYGTVVLENANITSADASALTVKKGSNVTVNIAQDSTLMGYKDGITVEKNARLTVTGTAALTAVGGNGVDSANGGSGIGGEGTIVISDLNKLTAEGYGKHAFGVGGNTPSITIENTNVAYAKGGYVQPQFISDTSYGKSEPEGGAAIGSMYNGAVITLKGVTVEKVDGGSKCAAIGALYHKGVTLNIEDSLIKEANGGNAAAGIGGGRITNDPDTDVTVNIHNSTVTAVGGQFAAGIGSGYDTHCSDVATFPIHTINITGDSVINATGGKYGAGIGTGYHAGGLAGMIEASVSVNAVAGESREKYTEAMAVGFGVIDPDREGANNTSSFNYKGTVLTVADAPLVNP